MILVDSSIWIGHLRASDPRLLTVLANGDALMHPFVLGELALGRLARRAAVIADLGELPAARVIDDAEVLSFIDSASLSGSGLGYVDAHLVASALSSSARLWSNDRKLHAVAARLGAAIPLH